MLVAVNQEFLEDSEAEKKWLGYSQRQTALYASKIREENARLKRLLKNCKSKVIYVKSVRSDARKIICDDIVSDIDEVLNECI